MYNAIVMSDLERKPSEFTESFNIDLNSMVTRDDLVWPTHDQFYQEAVFSVGKSSVKSIEDQFGVVKNILMEEINKQKSADADDKSFKFDPKKFWKHQEIKKLEEIIQKTFGFRSVVVLPYIEKYRSDTDDFETGEMNCVTYYWDRFPIDGLVTDKGFYDSTHSITLEMAITLGLIQKLEASEIVAVMLHEIGHNIDPAIVTVTYAETNILSKYLTDRSKSISKAEKKYISKLKKRRTGVVSSIIIQLAVLTGVIGSIIAVITLIAKAVAGAVKSKSSDSSSPIKDNILMQLKKLIQEDVKNEFNRKDYSEAFADNFARMYGYGAELSRAFKKLSKNLEKAINSRYKKEKMRQMMIIKIVTDALKNEHKTDVHRIKALIKSYYEDINDPNTPAEVKKQLREDVKEVEEVLDSYLNDFSELQNRVNRMISEEIDIASSTPTDKKDDDKSDDKQEDIKESVIFFESKAAYEKLMKAKESLTSSERTEVKKLFGSSLECSFAKDKDGYYCYTHRCRSKSYPSVSAIPKKDVEFIRSTS